MTAGQVGAVVGERGSSCGRFLVVHKAGASSVEGGNNEGGDMCGKCGLEKTVITGGLAGGLVLNIVNAVTWGGILKERWNGLVLLGLGRPSGPRKIVMEILLGFLVGILVAELYALARPRLGPGPKTALTTGVLAWLLVGFIPACYTAAWAVYGLKIPVVGAAGQFVGILLASLIAGKMYREEEHHVMH